MEKFEHAWMETLHRLEEDETRALLSGIETPRMDARTQKRLREKLLQDGVCVKKRKEKRLARWLIPVAVCLALMLALFSIPAVAEAVTNWFVDVLRVQRYFHQREEDRTPNPDIDGLTENSEGVRQSSRVLLLSDTENLEKVNDLRKQNGFPAYDPDDWAFLTQNDAPYISSLFYDGVELIVFTFVPCDPTDFMSGYIDSRISELRLDVMTLRDGTITAPDGSQTGIYSQGTGLIPQKDYWNEDGSANVEAIRRDGGVWLETDYMMVSCDLSELAPGKYTVTIDHSILDGNVEDMSVVGEVAVIRQTFELDTVKALAAITETPLDPVAFSGVYPMVVKNYGKEILTWREDVDLSGFVARPSVQRRPTGIRVYLDYTYPEAWDDYTKEYIWCLGGLNYEVIVNGESTQQIIGVNNHWIDIALMQSEWARIESLVLRPVACVVETEAATPDGEAVERYEPLPQFDIVIPLS